MVEPRPGQSGQSCNADDRFRIGRDPAPGKIRAEDEERTDQPYCDHQAVRAERKRTNVDEGIQPNSSSCAPSESRASSHSRSRRTSGDSITEKLQTSSGADQPFDRKPG